MYEPNVTSRERRGQTGNMAIAKMTVPELETFLRKEFPQVFGAGDIAIEAADGVFLDSPCDVALAIVLRKLGPHVRDVVEMASGRIFELAAQIGVRHPFAAGLEKIGHWYWFNGGHARFYRNLPPA